MLAKTSFEGCDVRFAFNVLLAGSTSTLWVIILPEYKSLTNKSHSRWDPVMLKLAIIASLIQFALHLVQIPNFAIDKILPHTLQLVWYRGLQLLNQLSAKYRPSYLTQRVWPLVHQSKELYSTPILSSLWATWPTGAIWHCFSSSTVISWQQFCHIGQLL